MAIELAVGTGLGSGIGSVMASGDLENEEERPVELARRERDWRGPTLAERKDEVDDFRKRVGVADGESLPLEGLRGENLGLATAPEDAREDDTFLIGLVRGDARPGDVPSERLWRDCVRSAACESEGWTGRGLVLAEDCRLGVGGGREEDLNDMVGRQVYSGRDWD